MKDETIRLIYKLKRNIIEDPAKIVKEHICATTGLSFGNVGDREIYAFVLDVFLDFFNSADDKMMQLQSYFYSKERSEIDDIHAMLITLKVSQVRNENMEFVNGFREVEGVDWPLNKQ